MECQQWKTDDNLTKLSLYDDNSPNRLLVPAMHRIHRAQKNHPDLDCSDGLADIVYNLGFSLICRRFNN